MKHALLIATFCLSVFCAASQGQVKLYHEKDGQKILVYANNDLYCPASVKLDLKVTNLRCEGPCPEWVLLTAKAQKQLVTTLIPADLKKPFQFGYGFRWFYGNTLSTTHAADQPYYLPFEKGKEFRLVQGYDGPTSHKGQNALDFNMPEGTALTAAREGIVVRVVQNFNTSCAEERCKEFNNSIVVYHSDGTFGEYTHIRMNGSLVQPGSVVKAGQLIGYSGNTGWSHGPHLHFMVYTFKENGIYTIPTKFKNNNALMYLQPGERYTRTYD